MMSAPTLLYLNWGIPSDNATILRARLQRVKIPGTNALLSAPPEFRNCGQFAWPSVTDINPAFDLLVPTGP